jgi:hypothetical protein
VRGEPTVFRFLGNELWGFRQLRAGCREGSGFRYPVPILEIAPRDDFGLKDEADFCQGVIPTHQALCLPYTFQRCRQPSVGVIEDATGIRGPNERFGIGVGFGTVDEW